ncbi:NmrA family NAD(P)-binding protein [Nocardia ignorata]|uniref:NmrA-like family protein n=1 Tax=Nocardia ignorata TaxID=145285 RepID=A0A4R6PSF2_NOCIG|nr:NmrA family NAD(P)-binding protein [Nocardia ignorata]TDP41761.1 NmrA-like family protein [Nocardia ignorata]
MIAAARAAEVDQLVFSGIATMGPAESWGQEGKRRIEDAIRAAGLRYTLLRPVRFMENYLMHGSPVDGIRAGGEHRHRGGRRHLGRHRPPDPLPRSHRSRGRGGADRIAAQMDVTA